MASVDENAFPLDGTWEPPASDEERFIVDVAGFEGPLDVLLALARRQKVDLARISILELADQYLGFIAELRRVRLDLAADYLVMAAWLAYLKSRLLLPPEEQADEPSAEEMAEALAFRLRQLEAMRDVAERLMHRPLLNRDVFVRGAPEGVPVEKAVRFEASLFDLLSAYSEQRRRRDSSVLHIRPQRVYSIEEALERLRKMVPNLPDWETMARLLPLGLQDDLMQRSALAATLVAGLELTRQGVIQIRQLAPFGPIYLRRSPTSP